MIKNLDVEAYFLNNTTKKTFTELSLNAQTGKPLVASEAQGYDYETFVLNLFQSNPIKVVDAVYIKDNTLYFIEFKGGFKQRITYDTFDISNWKCQLTQKTCTEGAKIFLKNQDLMISQLIESIKGKLLESHTLLYKMILPQCSQCDKEYEVHYIAVIDETNNPIESIENNLQELGRLPQRPDNPKVRLKQSLTKYAAKDHTGTPIFFDHVDVWNTYDFNQRIRP